MHPPVPRLHGAKSGKAETAKSNGQEANRHEKGRLGRPESTARKRAGTPCLDRPSSNPAAHLRRGGLNIGRKGQAEDRPQLSFAAIDSISETS